MVRLKPDTTYVCDVRLRRTSALIALIGAGRGDRIFP